MVWRDLHLRGFLDWRARRAWLCLCDSSVCGGNGWWRGGWWSSGKVHGPQGVVVDLHSFGQRLGVPTVTLTRHVAALGAVVFFVHQMVAGAEGHQVGVVGWRGDGD